MPYRSSTADAGTAVARSAFVAGSLIAVLLAGCGGALGKSRTQTRSATTSSRAPLYRVGQYCTGKHEATYRAHGLTCNRHHLVKL
jgi:hypothetical protein